MMTQQRNWVNLILLCVVSFDPKVLKNHRIVIRKKQTSARRPNLTMTCAAAAAAPVAEAFHLLTFIAGSGSVH